MARRRKPKPVTAGDVIKLAVIVVFVVFPSLYIGISTAIGHWYANGVVHSIKSATTTTAATAPVAPG